MFIAHNDKNQAGFSLVELMVAMLIGLLLLLGVSSTFMANKRVYKDQEAMSRLQENIRFAVGLLIKDINMAGYSGCADEIDRIFNHVNGASDDDSIFSFVNAVEGSENTSNWQPSGSPDAVSNMNAGSDAISVRYFKPIGIRIAASMPTISAELKVTSVGDLEIEDIIAVSDCDDADIMQITQVQTSASHLQHNTGSGVTPGNATKNLQKKYGVDAEIMRFVSNRYYIRNNAQGSPSLYRKEINGNELELVEGVENMQLLYGEDTSGNDKTADTYVTATNVTNWDNVVSVRLGLLLQTVDENRQLDPDTRVYTVLGGDADGGASIGPANDYRRRRVYTSTIQIRNRSF